MNDSAYYDAVLVGAGPNGLAAAITLARAGLSVIVFEAKQTIGGGMRTADLTLPEFHHDVCSAIHPLGLASPFFKDLPLADYGLKWIQPDLALAHPFDDMPAAYLDRSLEKTSESLAADGLAYKRLIEFLVDDWEELLPDILAPLRFPRKPFALAGFGLLALRSATGLAEKAFEQDQARGFFTGMAGHSMIELDKPGTASFSLVLAMLGHAVGWPIPEGGSQQIASSLGSYLQDLGGEISVDHPIQNLSDLPPARVYLFDVTPRQLLEIAGDRFPKSYRRKLQGYRYGPGVFKIDWALDGPIPWKDEACCRAGTVHLGGTMAEIAAAESEVWQGIHPEKPFVLLAQQSIFDHTRAPAGHHTAWAYCHVPSGSTVDMTEAVTAQIERFAPGFRDLILATHTFTACEMQSYNPNYVGGDINGGVQDLRQLYTRPAARIVPYSTPDPQIFICSSSTPPGGGVHGMCGYHAAQSALRARFR